MPRETMYKSLDFSNVEPLLVRPSGGIPEAAIARSELNFEVSKIDTSLSSKLSLVDVGRLYKEVILNSDDMSGVTTRTVTQTIIDNVEYNFTTFECIIQEWTDTREIWRTATFEGDEQIDLVGRFFVIGEGMVRIIFQSDEQIPNGKIKIILQRTPPASLAAPVDNN